MLWIGYSYFGCYFAKGVVGGVGRADCDWCCCRGWGVGNSGNPLAGVELSRLAMAGDNECAVLFFFLVGFPVFPTARMIPWFALLLL